MCVYFLHLHVYMYIPEEESTYLRSSGRQCQRLGAWASGSRNEETPTLQNPCFPKGPKTCRHTVDDGPIFTHLSLSMRMHVYMHTHIHRAHDTSMLSMQNLPLIPNRNPIFRRRPSLPRRSRRRMPRRRFATARTRRREPQARFGGPFLRRHLVLHLDPSSM